MKKKDLCIFLGILVIGAFLRFYQLGQIPLGLHVDEAYFGYNTYSLLKTVRDMTGNFLPIHFASFLFSPAGYSYISIPWIFFFGLSAFSIRFTSALFGLLTLPITFLLAKKLTQDKAKQLFVGLFSMSALAISPWNIILDRTATENVIVVFFLGLALLFFLFWREKKSFWYGVFGFLSCLITLFLYQAPRAFLPLFLPIALWILFYKQRKKLILSAVLFGFCILLPVILILRSPQLSQRIRMLSVFTYPGIQLQLDEQIREDGVLHTTPFISRLFHNKLLAYGSQITQNYFLHFSYNFLFNDEYLPIRYKVISTGLFYVIELPCILLGLLFLLKRQRNIFLLLCTWILIGPIGSALTFDDIPNMQRTLLIFPALSIIEGFGIFYLTEILKRFSISIRVFLYTGMSILIVYSVGFFLHQYFVNNTIHRPWYRQEGTQELVQQVDKIKNNYSYVDIGNADPNLSIFFLFYSHYNPSVYQQYLAGRPQLLVGAHYGSISFDAYRFDSDGCPLQEKKLLPTDILPTVVGKPGILYVDDGICVIPKTHTNILSVIKRPDGTPAYYLVEYLR